MICTKEERQNDNDHVTESKIGSLRSISHLFKESCVVVQASGMCVRLLVSALLFTQRNHRFHPLLLPSVHSLCSEAFSRSKYCKPLKPRSRKPGTFGERSVALQSCNGFQAHTEAFPTSRTTEEGSLDASCTYFGIGHMLQTPRSLTHL
jgi:hypothetical protein